jgi:hypothetical protein
MLFSFVAASWAAKSGAEYKFRGVPDGSQPNGGLVADRGHRCSNPIRFPRRHCWAGPLS